YPRDQVALALAGPTSNLLLSFASFTLFLAFGAMFNHLYPENPVLLESLFPLTVTVGDVPLAGVWFVVFRLVTMGMLINTSLAVFNLVPLPPLDGFWILRGLAPRKVNVFLSRVHVFGFVILIVVLQIEILQIVLLYPFFLLYGLYGAVTSLFFG
ncbi:MAG: hypothetical protein GF331_25100, partial [Chitinivibrionales bacterium]|nr:hypothetical protein [Chitinivibrionales bacterium]